MAPSPFLLLFSTPPILSFAPLLWFSVTLSLLHDSHRLRTRPFLVLPVLALTLSALFFLAPSRGFPPPSEPELTLPTTVRQARLHPIPRPLPAPVRQAMPSVSPPSVAAPTPSPIPSPSPVPAAQPSPAQQQQPSPGPQPAPAVSPTQVGTSRSPTLDECGGALTRMQVVLLLEFIAEVIFLIVRFLATNDEEEPTLDLSFRAFIFSRSIYAIPVIALNVSILWIGGGPTGACLPAHSQLQIAFTHLILYALFCIGFVVFGMYRLAEYDSEDTSTYSPYYTPPPRWGKYGYYV